MARIFQSGVELNSTTAGVEFDSFTNSPTIATDVVRSGSYSLKFAPSVSVEAAVAVFASSDQQAAHFARIYIYFATLPNAACRHLTFGNAAGTGKVCIRFNTTGNVLEVFNIEDNATVGTSSSAVTTGKWYKLELKCDTTTLASTVVEARLDGTSFGSGTINITTGIARMNFGLANVTNSGVAYVDDIALNNDSGANQNSWCGEGRVLHLKPNAAGDSNSFAIAVGGDAGAGNNFTRVDEITPDDATTYNGSAVLDQEDLFNVDATPNVITSDDTINTVCVGVRMADLVSADATSAFKLEVMKTSGGTKTQSSALIPNSTTWITNGSSIAGAYPLVTYADPDGNSWTKSILDTMQIGYALTAFNVQTIAISTVWASVDYTDITSTPHNYGKYIRVGDGMSRSEGAT